MKRYAWIFLMLLAPSLWAVGGDKNFQFTDFHCGVDSYHSPLSIPDCFVSDSLNMLFDKQAGATKRQGFTIAFSSNSYQFTGLWSYTDGSNNVWMVARASDSIVATTGVGTAKFNVRIATVSANNVVNAAIAQGKIYFVDQSQGVYFWDGTTMTQVPSSPLGSLITSFHNRLWVAGLAIPNGSQLAGSKFLDGTTWTASLSLSGIATDAVLYSVALQDNSDFITALYPGVNDTLYIFKNYAIQGLYGFDQTDFNIKELSRDAGCIDQRSIQPFYSGLVFASARGIESFDGYSSTRISDPIKDRVDALTLGSQFSQSSWVQQNSTDWNTGTFSPSGSLSTTTVSNVLVLSTGTFTENSSTQWNNGTANNVTINSNSLVLATNNSGTVTDPSFENSASCPAGGFGALNANWSASAVWTSGSTRSNAHDSCTLTPQSGSCFSTADYNGNGASATAYILNASDNSTLYSKPISVNSNDSCAWTQDTLSSAGLLGKRIKLRFRVVSTSNGTNDIVTADSYILGGDITFYRSRESNGSTSGQSLSIDNIQNGSSTITTGSFVSQTFNTGTSKVYAQFQATTTINTQSVGPVLRHSAVSGGPFYDLTSTQNSNVLSNQYLQYFSSFTIGSADTALSSLSGVSIEETASSGTWTSAVHNISTATSFGNLSVTEDLSTGGNIAFNVCTANNGNMTGKTCSVIPANGQITTSVQNFAQIIASFTVTASTNAPALDNFTLQWYTGVRRPPMASAIYDNRYWLSVTTDTSDSQNDATLVLAKGSSGVVWSILDIKAGAFTLWKNALYHSDALALGNVYNDNQGYADNGVAINGYITTKDYPVDTFINDDYYDSLYFAVENLGNYNVNVRYVMDGATANSFALSSFLENEQSGRLYAKAPFPIDAAHQVFGKTIRMTFQESDINGPFRFLGGYLNYHSRPVL